MVQKQHERRCARDCSRRARATAVRARGRARARAAAASRCQAGRHAERNAAIAAGSPTSTGKVQGTSFDHF
ncbi:hypothetical protein chiPu_0001332 [Chiloscyllium punctatum]|uniref:Uncharacterized protein n=1 Tax=Chiloscyllium punctatum TaxID=137246 RepID=A0A401RXQ7_CHIPU|nr:hypothetical protein [Chiloscyllium punctatum]